MTSILCLAAVSAEILWTKPICVETNRYIGWPTVCCCANGELLAVFSGDRDRHVCPYGKVQLVRSKDGGRSWKVLSRIDFRKPLAVAEAHEPHVAELKDGTLVVQLRYHGEKWSTLQCESADGGKTWSEVHETGIPGFPSHLLPLQDGRLLSTFSNRKKKPWAECAVLSANGGKTWDVDNAIVLSVQDGGNPEDMGYPSTAQLKDGSLVTVYYQVEKPHKTPCLMATKWQLDESR